MLVQKQILIEQINAKSAQAAHLLKSTPLPNANSRDF